jgi:hypothetical protein
MPLPVPPHIDDNPAKALRYYTAGELLQIDLKRRGVTDEGSHTHESLGPDGAGTPRLYSCKWSERYAAALTVTSEDCPGSPTSPVDIPRSVSGSQEFRLAGWSAFGTSYEVQILCSSSGPGNPVTWQTFFSGFWTGPMAQDGDTLTGTIHLTFPGMPIVECDLNISIVLPDGCHDPCA